MWPQQLHKRACGNQPIRSMDIGLTAAWQGRRQPTTQLDEERRRHDQPPGSYGDYGTSFAGKSQTGARERHGCLSHEPRSLRCHATGSGLDCASGKQRHSQSHSLKCRIFRRSGAWTTGECLTIVGDCNAPRSAYRSPYKDEEVKTWIAFVGLLVAMQAGAQQVLRYRMNDPFLFCTHGQDRRLAPAPCWIPLPPYTGNFMPMPYCDPPNTYGKSWSQADIDSLQQYVSICPQALTSGPWGGPGAPDAAPLCTDRRRWKPCSLPAKRLVCFCSFLQQQWPPVH